MQIHANTPAQRTRLTNLDCIRSVALLLVFLHHVGTRFSLGELDPVETFLLRYGFLGVDLFFALSGFLICKSIMEMPVGGGKRNFFLRRILRIFPLYYIAVALYICSVVFVAAQKSGELSNIWMTLTFLTGWAMPFVGREALPYTITWSLSVEEFAYLVVGLYFLFVARSRYIFLISLIAVATLARGFLYFQDYPDVHMFPLARIDAIAIGCLYYLFPRKNLLIAGSCLFILYFFFAQDYMDTWLRQTLFWTAFAAFSGLLILLSFKIKFLFENRAAIIFGNIGVLSYFMYLFHLFFIDGFILVLTKAGIDYTFWLVSVISFVPLWLAAFISFRYFEKPMMRWGRRFETYDISKP